MAGHHWLRRWTLVQYSITKNQLESSNTNVRETLGDMGLIVFRNRIVKDRARITTMFLINRKSLQSSVLAQKYKSLNQTMMVMIATFQWASLIICDDYFFCGLQESMSFLDGLLNSELEKSCQIIYYPQKKSACWKWMKVRMKKNDEEKLPK